jgi:hypothetical protein
MDAEEAVGPGGQGGETQALEDRRAELEAVYTWVMEHDAELMRRLGDA